MWRSRSIPTGALQYFTGDGFKSNALRAARFRRPEDAQRRSENSIACRRMAESGAKLGVIKIGQRRLFAHQLHRNPRRNDGA